MTPFRHVLVPTDFSTSSEAALAAATDLAACFDAELTVLHVCEIPTLAYSGMEYATADMVTPLFDAADAELAALRAKIAPRVRRVKTECKAGFAAEEILARADALGVDLIVVGTHGRRGLPRAVLGSVAERVVRLAKVPVLTVRGAST